MQEYTETAKHTQQTEIGSIHKKDRQLIVNLKTECKDGIPTSTHRTEYKNTM